MEHGLVSPHVALPGWSISRLPVVPDVPAQPRQVVWPWLLQPKIPENLKLGSEGPGFLHLAVFPCAALAGALCPACPDCPALDAPVAAHWC